MATRISGKAIFSGIAALASGVVSSFTLLASRILGFTVVAGSGSGYYGASIVDRYLPGLILGRSPFGNVTGILGRLIPSTGKVDIGGLNGLGNYLIVDTFSANGFIVATIATDEYYFGFAYSTDAVNWTIIPGFESASQYKQTAIGTIDDTFVLVYGYNMWVGNDPSNISFADFTSNVPQENQTNGQWYFFALASNEDYLFFGGNYSILIYVKSDGTYILKNYTDQQIYSGTSLFPRVGLSNLYIRVNSGGGMLHYKVSMSNFNSLQQVYTPFNFNNTSGFHVVEGTDSILITSSDLSNGQLPYPKISTDAGETWADANLFTSDENTRSYTYTNPVSGYKRFFLQVYSSANQQTSIWSTSDVSNLVNDWESYSNLDRYTVSLSYLNSRNPINHHGSPYSGTSMFHNLETGSIYPIIQPALGELLKGESVFYDGKFYFYTVNEAYGTFFKYYYSEFSDLSNPVFIYRYFDGTGNDLKIKPAFSNILTQVEVQASIGNQDEGTLEVLAPVDVYVNTTGSVIRITEVQVQNISPDFITYDLALLDEGVSLTDSNSYLADVQVLPNGASSFLTDFIGSGNYLNLNPGQRVVVLPSSVDSVEVKVYGRPE